MDLAWVDQTTFAEYVQSLSNPCHSYQYDLEPPGCRAAMDFALPIRNFMLKLNGMDRADPEALVSGEEREIMARYTRRSLADLEAAWEPVENIRVKNAEIEQEKSDLSIAEPGDSILLVGYECHMQHANGHIRFAYPKSGMTAAIEKLG